MRHCPACNSICVTQNERGDKKCQKCGWIHHEGKQKAIFTTFGESEIDKTLRKMGLE
jgi:Zn-finger protein